MLLWSVTVRVVPVETVIAPALLLPSRMTAESIARIAPPFVSVIVPPLIVEDCR